MTVLLNGDTFMADLYAALAATTAGDFIHGQCWLKFQEDPTNPHVNMRGDYSAEYRKTHPSAPKSVQWVAGSIVEEGQTVGNGTWSSRSHWRR